MSIAVGSHLIIILRGNDKVLNARKTKVIPTVGRADREGTPHRHHSCPSRQIGHSAVWIRNISNAVQKRALVQVSAIVFTANGNNDELDATNSDDISHRDRTILHPIQHVGLPS
jgi:hypothetical protein